MQVPTGLLLCCCCLLCLLLCLDVEHAMRKAGLWRTYRDEQDPTSISIHQQVTSKHPADRSCRSMFDCMQQLTACHNGACSFKGHAQHEAQYKVGFHNTVLPVSTCACACASTTLLMTSGRAGDNACCHSKNSCEAASNVCYSRLVYRLYSCRS